MSNFTRRQFVHTLSVTAGAAALGVSPLAWARSSRSLDEMAFMSATDLVGLVRSGEISSTELTRYFIGRIEKHDGAVNAVVVRDFDRAMEAARAADSSMAKGKVTGPLHGLPMTVKESFDIAGLATTWGIPALRNNIAQQDSALVQSLKQAGAVLMGKTNAPLNLADFQAYNDIYGTTSNPWNLEYVPGGSSGGSAAALAAGLTGLDSGSDVGGSIRNPASFCGVYGHKPTWGIVPQRGHGLPGWLGEMDIVVCGPLARSADDLQLALEVQARPNDLNAPA